MWQCAAKIREESMRRGEMTKRGRGGHQTDYDPRPWLSMPVALTPPCQLEIRFLAPFTSLSAARVFLCSLPFYYQMSSKKNTFVFTACFIRASLPTFLVESGGVHGYLSLHDKITVGDSFWDWSWASAAKHIWGKKMLRKVDWIFFFLKRNRIIYVTIPPKSLKRYNFSLKM